MNEITCFVPITYDQLMHDTFFTLHCVCIKVQAGGSNTEKHSVFYRQEFSI